MEGTCKASILQYAYFNRVRHANQFQNHSSLLNVCANVLKCLGHFHLIVTVSAWLLKLYISKFSWGQGGGGGSMNGELGAHYHCTYSYFSVFYLVTALSDHRYFNGVATFFGGGGVLYFHNYITFTTTLYTVHVVGTCNCTFFVIL